ncbi:hypothetical protein K7X08_002140 [Anisodus acutangulus]|uniref:Uncharacterized protein n=1 Tax=Anisodus acutangulus TaxID=402998 RepID=A0A9Q1R3W7_9SOLA|nr:hypothetical protein K7X08_002140 [Anisodus acutangulus]
MIGDCTQKKKTKRAFSTYENQLILPQQFLGLYSLTLRALPSSLTLFSLSLPSIHSHSKNTLSALNFLHYFIQFLQLFYCFSGFLKIISTSTAELRIGEEQEHVKQQLWQIEQSKEQHAVVLSIC